MAFCAWVNVTLRHMLYFNVNVNKSFDVKPKCGLLQIEERRFFVRCLSLSTNLAMLDGF